MNRQAEAPNKYAELELAVGVPISLSEFSLNHNLNVARLNRELECSLREHYLHYGCKPFSLEYDPILGRVIRANAAVGILKAGTTVVKVQPKVPNVSVGKCLGLAQRSLLDSLNINRGSTTQIMMSENEDYSSVDFLAFSLMDNILKVKKNGFARTFEEVFGSMPKLTGIIDFYKTISEGKPPIQPVGGSVEPSINIFPNRVLKYALKICKEKTRSKSVIELASTLLESFRDVEDVDDNFFKSYDIVLDFSLPRSDYAHALSFANAIIQGRALGEGEEALNSPSFTLDMDKVFEGYCSNEIMAMLGQSKNYEVDIQKPIPHAVVPRRAGLGAIVPDIVVKMKKGHGSVVVDLKNKYSALRNDGNISIGNNDLYQICYYAKTLETNYCILAYPGANPSLQYAIRSSESEAAYESRRNRKKKQLLVSSTFNVLSKDSIKVVAYCIDLSGTLRNTRKSVASLCQLIVDMLEGRF